MGRPAVRSSQQSRSIRSIDSGAVAPLKPILEWVRPVRRPATSRVGLTPERGAWAKGNGSVASRSGAELRGVVTGVLTGHLSAGFGRVCWSAWTPPLDYEVMDIPAERGLTINVHSAFPAVARRRRSTRSAARSPLRWNTPAPPTARASMQIIRSSIDTAKGSADWFTGDVYIDAVAAPAGSSTFAAASVHFTPGARTAWHTHPHGQTIFVTEGVGVCQREGPPPRRSVPAIASSSNPVRATGTALPRAASWSTSPCSRGISQAAPSTGAAR